jgi:hypothetical protein
VKHVESIYLAAFTPRARSFAVISAERYTALLGNSMESDDARCMENDSFDF